MSSKPVINPPTRMAGRGLPRDRVEIPASAGAVGVADMTISPLSSTRESPGFASVSVDQGTDPEPNQAAVCGHEITRAVTVHIHLPSGCHDHLNEDLRPNGMGLLDIPIDSRVG